MVDKLTYGFFGCVNPCNIGWQSSSFNQVKLNFKRFERELSDMAECEQCKVKFTLLKRKKSCSTCGLNYCSSCIKRSNGSRQCNKCSILAQWPLDMTQLSSLRIRDFRHYLSTCNIETATCREKQELIDLTIAQLRLKHLRHSHRADISNQANTDNRHHYPSNTTPDDGIRVRSFIGEVFEIYNAADGNLHLNTDDTESGIRVFASTQINDTTDIPADLTTTIEETPQTNVNIVHSDSSSSSSWSLLHSDSARDRISDTLSHSSTFENSSVQLQNECDPISQSIESVNNNQSELQAGERQPEVPSLSLTDSPQIIEVALETFAQPPTNSKLSVAADVVKLSSLENEESIKDLSVRQCKEILSLHRVDFSGVWEKHELVSKVKMLWKDYKDRQEDAKDLPEEQLCKICMDAVMDCVLLECGHIVSCTNCGKQMAECPVCRQNVIRVVKTFRA